MQLAVKNKLLEEINEKYNQQQEEWESIRVTLERRSAEVEVVFERRRLDLLIAQGKLLQTKAESKALINDLKNAGSRTISGKCKSGEG